MPVNLVSAGGGTTTLTPASSASNYTVTIPSATTTMVGTDATQTLTNKTIQGGTITSGTVQTTTSGTTADFTGIPSWVKRITVVINGISSSGTSPVIVQLGTSGGFTTTGYASCGVYAGGTNQAGGTAATNGLLISGSPGAADVRSGTATIALLGSNTWVLSSCGGQTTAGNYVWISGGTVTLGATLDRVRITFVNGTDTFDAGSINILYE